MADSSLSALLSPVVSGLGLDLEQVEVTAAGRRRRVCVVIDRDGGVDLDAVADVSKAVSEALDASGALGDSPYVLEVTSPGVDRPLTEQRHWRRAIGRLVACRLTDGVAIDGRIIDCTDDSVTIDTPDGPREVALADVSQARVQVEFRRADDEVG